MTLTIQRPSYRSKLTQLATGTVLAQIIPAAVSPVLTRLYSPTEIGEFTSFFAVSIIIGTVINLRYDFAILSAENIKDILSLGKLAIATSTALSALLLVIAYPLVSIIESATTFSVPTYWLVAVPVLVFIIGANNALQQINTRFGNYKILTQSYLLKSVTSSTSQPAFGFLGFNSLGLAIGLIAAETCGTFRLLKKIRKDLRVQAAKLRDLVSLANAYKRFPLLSTWSALTNALSQNSPIIIIAALFHSKEAGMYALVYRILSLPISMLGNALSKIYSEEAAAEKADTSRATRSFKRTLLMAVAIAIPLFTTLFFSVEKLIPWVFGAEWTDAGKLAILLIPVLCCRFVAFTISTTNSIFQRQTIELIWNAALVALIASCALLASSSGWSFHTFARAYSFSVAAHYLVLIGISWKVSHESKTRGHI